MSTAEPICPEPVPARPETPPVLRRGQVHLWHADLERTSGDESLLDTAERERAELMIARVRERFTASRCLLRRVLGGYTGRDPATLRFETVGEGKPRLVPFTEGVPRFNLSHADRRWLLAVSTAEVGVDVERTDRRVDIERVARRIFRAAETDAILRERGYARRRAFFRAWTAREALVKARGEGMFTLSLEAEVRVGPSPIFFLEGEDAGRWTVLEVPETFPHCAALAVADRPESVTSFRVEDPPSG